ncbi:dUTP diphosphatase [Falsiroseomonas sp. CW058]|uniref:dUTP diphosphatase n=1 Tax=Falsiroseomonas sp. CW058 TaxID=3388664 RepID=UPI003D31E9A2
MNDATLAVMRLTTSAAIPSRGSAGAVGYDLCADLQEAGEVTIHPRGRAAIPTGIAVAIPEGLYGRIAPRSGLALKAGVDVFGGVIDPDYRGEIKVILHNSGSEPLTIGHGDRIAQIILERVAVMPVMEVDRLDATVRGSSGFGSTGMSAVTEVAGA